MKEPTKAQLKDLSRQIKEAGIPNKLGACQLMVLALLKDREQNAPKSYVIIEEVTGLIDGYYPRDDAIEMAEHWDQIRPQNRHFIFGAFGSMRLTDNVYMPKVNRREDPYIKTDD